MEDTRVSDGPRIRRGRVDLLRFRSLSSPFHPLTGQRLRVLFDEAAVTRILRDRGLPVWGQVRPTVLVCLGIDDQGERR